MESSDSKRCSKCQEEKPLVQFPKLRNQCKVCRRKYHSSYAEGHREQLSAYQREWYQNNREQCRDMGKRWYENNREKVREIDRLRRYGMSKEQHSAMLASQGGRCAICRTQDPGGRGGWHTDHDHNTGRVRGLLCDRCNRGLGFFSDDATTLDAAATYLRQQSTV